MDTLIKYFEISFTDEISKKAYLKANKWIAQNIMNKVEVEDTYFKIRKTVDKDLPTFTVELYCSLDSEELIEGMCDKCKAFHSSFFVNEEYNCNSCKIQAYLKQMKEKLIIKQNYRKEVVKRLLAENEKKTE